MMTEEEKRTVAVAALLLLLASGARFVWEIREETPMLPPAEVPAALVEATREAVANEERMSTPLAEGERLDPNREEWVELARLPRIGPALAERIVAEREGGGAFVDEADLLRVTGIGPATLEQIRDHLDLTDPPPSRPLSGHTSLGRPPGSTALDVNTASAMELESLPGIGPALAARIIEHRSSIRGFRSVEQLIEVPGIGPSTLERLNGRVFAGF